MNRQTNAHEVRITEHGVLRCPHCGDQWTHIDQVDVAARREDGPFTDITVDATTGRIDTQGATAIGTHVGIGRRHRIVLAGSCEICGATLELIFTQHKGQTLVEWVMAETKES